MPRQITAYRIFIASPGGLQEERKEFRRIVEDFNEATALPRSVLFQAVGWEDTLGGFGRPQEVINEDLKKCDYFLMILWDRWGSRPDVPEKSRFTSGTEEEFHAAKESLADQKQFMREMVVLFKAVDLRQLSDPGDELRKVIAFRKDLESRRECLYNTFDDLVAFEELVQRFLNSWLIEHENANGGNGKFLSEIAAEPFRPPDENPSSFFLMPGSQLVSEAQKLAAQGKVTDAESAFAKSVESGNDPEALNAYATFLLRIGRLSQAQELYQKLITMSSRSGSKWEAVARGGIGAILKRRNRFADAEWMFRSALELSERLDLPALRADQLRNLGDLFAQRGELKQAETYLDDAILIYKRLEARKGFAQTQNILGQVNRQRGNFQAAEQNFLQARTIFTALGDEESIASVLNNFGWLQHQQGKSDAAEKSLREALALNLKLNRTESIAVNHRNLGLILQERQSYREAKEEFHAALQIYSDLGLPERAARIISELDLLSQKEDVQST
jgi:tetratricopeptide (TPR) repeat protein